MPKREVEVVGPVDEGPKRPPDPVAVIGWPRIDGDEVGSGDGRGGKLDSPCLVSALGKEKGLPDVVVERFFPNPLERG